MGQAIGNSGPCYCYGGGTSTFSNYSLSIKKDKTYPPGSKLAIDQHYFSRASPNILSSYRFLDATLPFTDTTITRIDVKDLVIYFNWKILNASNDSVGGGITPKYTTGDTTIRFEINY